MKVVVDASVVVKWILPDFEREGQADHALALLRGVQAGSVEPIQPPHWLAEVAAVLARLRPETAELTLDLLDALELPVAAEIAIYRRAARLAVELGHHLFDTLYHAVALERGALLITADDHYRRKALHLGAVANLAAWSEPAG
ncbi:MAG TPA: type II toxin-antitoxin system VapC family toxin [Thermoanaerobaculia bacterium]|nr:type II toxin-antitoxin system VapC family toxin [Thermoanaerobaculia bacterium]